ncbi:hypothetical protein Y032_0003g1548 [Ancylostoma ceylanicum]|uniref:Reverse transcriptase domain-containing protein n=1 Tax=Ancylostoma ceylanicum TaxID=53326 RepID=A0A016VYI9_9BILA|nr:hypothetical protein Y032_0003g1548 [Ancylostoma ceylanicum]
MQTVVINNANSPAYPTSSGVPQGTCIGPLMFLIFVNDLTSSLPPGSFCSMYADDSKIFTINDHTKLQLALDKLGEWSSKWDFDISTEKTAILGFGRNHPNVVFTLNGRQLTQLHSIKDLGITYSDTFDFEDYINDITAKARASCSCAM